jgi:hypothetical protein
LPCTGKQAKELRVDPSSLHLIPPRRGTTKFGDALHHSGRSTPEITAKFVPSFFALRQVQGKLLPNATVSGHILCNRRRKRRTIQSIYNEAQVQVPANHPTEAVKSLRETFQKGYSPEEARDDRELKSPEGRPEFGKLLTEFSGKTK